LDSSSSSLTSRITSTASINTLEYMLRPRNPPTMGPCKCCSNSSTFSSAATVLLLLVVTVLLLAGQDVLFLRPVHGFGLLQPHITSTAAATSKTAALRPFTVVLHVKKQTRTLEEEEAPADIGGAQFFGGNKEKEEFYDETAEQSAAMEAFVPEQVTTLNRFEDRRAFATDSVAALARSLQSQINAALYEDAPSPPSQDYAYTTGKLNWQTPFSCKAPTPLEELVGALSFYKHVDLAVVSGQQQDENQFELQWELSVAWPTFWEPRVLLLGSSTITLENSNNKNNDKQQIIVSQLDKVVDNGGDLLGTIGRQILPRFWDFYHVGMTPSAELLPRVNRKEPALFGLNYQTYDIPARWMVQPTVVETGSREDCTAQAIPNHAFSCIIKTMGPTRQRYVPTSPVEVQLAPDNNNQGKLKVQWNIPLSVEFQTNPEWPLPGEDEEAIAESQPECTYVYQTRRKVATVQYSGDPQDKEVTDIRKQLYEQVLKDGFQPKLDASTGRPIFFFLQNTAKPCYTNEGLGMCVYEWRPKWTNANEVGIELELRESDYLRPATSTSSGQLQLK